MTMYPGYYPSSVDTNNQSSRPRNVEVLSVSTEKEMLPFFNFYDIILVVTLIAIVITLVLFGVTSSLFETFGFHFFLAIFYAFIPIWALNLRIYSFRILAQRKTKHPFLFCLNPLNLFFRGYAVEVSEDLEAKKIIEWCDENTQHKWTRLYLTPTKTKTFFKLSNTEDKEAEEILIRMRNGNTGFPGVFYIFANEHDAMQFALKWS